MGGPGWEIPEIRVEQACGSSVREYQRRRTRLTRYRKRSRIWNPQGLEIVGWVLKGTREGTGRTVDELGKFGLRNGLTSFEAYLDVITVPV